jgi:hypothetical protein
MNIRCDHNDNDMIHEIKYDVGCNIVNCSAIAVGIIKLNADYTFVISTEASVVSDDICSIIVNIDDILENEYESQMYGDIILLTNITNNHRIMCDGCCQWQRRL